MLRIGIVMYQTSLTKGQELVSQRMVKEFKVQGYEAFLITSLYHDGNLAFSEEEVASRGGFVSVFDERLGIPVIRVGSMLTSWPPRRVSVLDFIDTLAKIVDDLKINVLITHSTLWNGPEDVLKFVEWRRNLSKGGVPQIAPLYCHMSHFQDPSPERYTIVERTFREAWNDTSLSQILTEADLILVTSPLEKEEMKRLGAPADRCFLFPGGIDETIDLDVDPSVLSRFNLPKDAKLVTSLGTVEERKNTLGVIEVARRLVDEKRVHFVIAGFGQGEYGEKVRAEAAKLQNVSFLGPITDREKTALIKASSVNIIMSRSEALGIAQLEFMWNGVPVITSGTGGQQWIVRDGVNGVVLAGPDDIGGAVGAVLKLSRKESLRRRLGRRASLDARRFSITRLVHSLSKRLEGLVHERGDDARLRAGMAVDEVTLEAMVDGGTTVVLTNRSMIVRSSDHDARAITMPIEDLTSITVHTRSLWYIPAMGLGATFLLLVSRLLHSPLESFIASSVATLPGGSLLDAIIPFIPALIAVPLFLASTRRGYVVHGGGRKVFVPSKFLRLLQLADRLSPSDLFMGDSD
ncbi:MAG: glycosyltransferase family 4 protein [Thaumarchaeota archaeon]|nr:glycosyltransferase family 4 protein [Nitrososphaerota archaeon]